ASPRVSLWRPDHGREQVALSWQSGPGSSPATGALWGRRTGSLCQALSSGCAGPFSLFFLPALLHPPRQQASLLDPVRAVGAVGCAQRQFAPSAVGKRANIIHGASQLLADARRLEPGECKALGRVGKFGEED